MDELSKYLYQQTDEAKQLLVLKVMAYLNSEEYDTEALEQDIGRFNNDNGNENSNVFKVAVDIYPYVQRYIYQQKCMSFL